MVRQIVLRNSSQPGASAATFISPAADMLKAGDPFPTWELVDHRGQQVTSANFAGKTYLLWYYPKAMTAG